jgi:hypothetical protein
MNEIFFVHPSRLAAVSYSSQTWAAGFSGGLSLCDARLNQKIVINNMTREREGIVTLAEHNRFWCRFDSVGARARR